MTCRKKRISGYKFKNKKMTQIGIRLGTWNVGSLCGGKIEEEEGGYLWSARSIMEGPRSLFYWS